MLACHAFPPPSSHLCFFFVRCVRDIVGRFAYSSSVSERMQLQPLPLQPDHVTRVTYDDFLGSSSGDGSSSESALFKILDAVATQGVALLTGVPCISGTIRDVCAHIALGAPMSSIYGAAPALAPSLTCCSPPVHAAAFLAQAPFSTWSAPTTPSTLLTATSPSTSTKTCPTTNPPQAYSCCTASSSAPQSQVPPPSSMSSASKHHRHSPCTGRGRNLPRGRFRGRSAAASG